MSWLRTWFGCCVCARSKKASFVPEDVKNEQTPLLAQADGQTSTHLPTYRFPEHVVADCLADLRTYVIVAHRRKMLPVSKSSVPTPNSPFVKMTDAATAERPAGQIWVRRMSPMGTPPIGKIPLDGDESGEDGTNDDYDVVEATRTGLLRCLDESKAAP